VRTPIPLLALLTLLTLATSKHQGPASTCATNSQRALGVFLGDFEVRATFRTGPGTWDSSLARSHFAWDLDRCVLVERFDGRRFGQPYRYLSIWGAAGDTVQPIQRLLVHSQHGVMNLSQGNWNAAGDTLIVADSVFVRGSWVHERHIMSRPVAGRFVSEGRRSEDGGRTWFSTSRSLYVRRGPN
jgi:hypothetical protein